MAWRGAFRSFFTKTRAWYMRGSAELLDETRYNVVDLVKFSCTLYCLHEYVADVTALAGPSMLPTFNEAGDIVVVNCLHVKLGRPLEKGDIVIARSPTNPGNTVCKRILGLPGDRILIQPQYWYQQEQVLEIPPGMLWLEGDNPFNSTDSRSYGPVPMALVKGLVAFKLYPLLEFGPLPRTYRKPGARYPKLDKETGISR